MDSSRLPSGPVQLAVWLMLVFIIPGPLCLVSTLRVKGLSKDLVPTPKMLAAKRGCSSLAAFPQDKREPLSRQRSWCWRLASLSIAREGLGWGAMALAFLCGSRARGSISR